MLAAVGFPQSYLTNQDIRMVVCRAAQEASVPHCIVY